MLLGIEQWKSPWWRRLSVGSWASAVCREWVATGESVHIRRKPDSDDDQRDAFGRAVDDVVSCAFTSLLPRLGDTDSDLGS
jgi:hypothetical protein